MSEQTEEEIEALYRSPIEAAEPEFDSSHLWIVSYSDFMTILMIFFLMLFAHRLWAKKVSWEERRIEQLEAARQSQMGMVQRLTKLATVDVAAERIDIHLPDALLFESGRSELRSTASDLLGQIAPELKDFSGEIVVEGHTDNEALGKGAKYKSNWELSVARSFSVIQCLTAKGVNPAHLSARGYGEFRPRALNDTAAHRAENRRIEIVLLNPRKQS